MAAAALLFILGSAAVVTSVDEINFESNNQYFDGPVVVLNYIASFDDEKIDINLSGNKLSQATGEEIEDSIQLNVISQDTKVEYNTRDVGVKKAYAIEGITETKSTYDNAVSWAESNCWDNDNNADTNPWYLTDKLTWTGVDYKVYCARTNGDAGQPASLDTGDRIWTTTWEYKINGDTVDTKTLTNGDGKSRIRIGDSVVVTGLGALSSGAGKPDNSNVYALHGNQYPGNWRLIDKSSYDSWVSSIEGSSYTTKLKEWGRGNLAGGESQFESFFNEDLDSAIQPAQGYEIYGGSWTDRSFQGGTYEKDVADVMNFPEFAIYAKTGEDCGTDCITIEKSVGEARIIGATGTEVGEYDSKPISVMFRNVGADGSFHSSVTGCSPSQFEPVGVTKRATVNAGETHTFEFDISFSAGSDQQQEYDGTCTVEILNSVADSTTTTVSLTGRQENSCIEGNEIVKVIDGRETIMVCTDGFNLEKQDGDAVCGPNEEPELVSTEGGLNDFECRDEGGEDEEVCGNNKDDDGDGKVDENCPGGGCEPIVLVSNPFGNDLTMPNIPCQIQQAVSGAWGAVTSAAALFAFLVGYGLRVPAMKMAKLHGAVRILDHRIKLGWIVGLVFGLLLAYGTFTFLSNPVIKWGLIILGAVGTALYIYLFGLGQFVRSLLPIGP